MNELTQEIRDLCKEKDALILAHYYVDEKVQDIADYIGDSFYLAKVAKSASCKTIVFCGVTFMGQSANILSPDKTVLMPDLNAVCPMALMVNAEDIQKMRAQYDDLAVVCYINSMAEIKALSDVCVTSSNALNIVKNLPNKNIFFIPDGNLGRYIANMCPEKNVILNPGHCHVHSTITADDVERAFNLHPNAQVLVHPECKEEVCNLADFIGSTKDIIEYSQESDCTDFIICTELGVIHEMKKRSPEKNFYAVNSYQICPNMKKVTLEKIRDCLKYNKGEITVDESLRDLADSPLERMLELGSVPERSLI
ncbi:quinolinate synthase NadA [Butyrivibrio sp. NC3005]|uniref:quinolinate synthase NadA n=1 Tax=Butyrivibrio sp. NC3005 TaxID=1280685 RepID=UPI00042753DE|nr:quinolinate synthase NadA [Butyrivibrio sp. NC3005]